MLRFAHVVDASDIGVVQFGGALGFESESPHGFRAAVGNRHNLDRNLTI